MQCLSIDDVIDSMKCNLFHELASSQLTTRGRGFLDPAEPALLWNQAHKHIFILPDKATITAITKRLESLMFTHGLG